jgi:hypothetical protein
MYTVEQKTAEVQTVLVLQLLLPVNPLPTLVIQMQVTQMEAHRGMMVAAPEVLVAALVVAKWSPVNPEVNGKVSRKKSQKTGATRNPILLRIAILI